MKLTLVYVDSGVSEQFPGVNLKVSTSTGQPGEQNPSQGHWKSFPSPLTPFSQQEKRRLEIQTAKLPNRASLLSLSKFTFVSYCPQFPDLVSPKPLSWTARKHSALAAMDLYFNVNSIFLLLKRHGKVILE